MPHQVALAEVQVDGAGVSRAEDALALDGAQDRAVAAVDDDELLGRAERRPTAAAGEWGCDQTRPPAAAAAQLAALRRAAPPAPCRPSPKNASSRVVERPLVGRRAEVRLEDVRVGKVDDRVLDRPREQAFGLAHEVLVERVLAGDQHRPALAGAAGPSPALPEARHRAGKPGDERDVEAADVDAELERAGRDHGASSPSNRRRSMSRRCSGV